MNKTTRKKITHAQKFIDQIMWAHRKSNIFFTAFETGILTYLADHKATLKTIASDLNLSERGVERILTVLLTLGIATKQKRSYQISVEYKPLFNLNSKDNVSGLIAHEIHLQNRWLQLSKSIRSGKPVKKSKDVRKPKDTKRFIAAMSNIGQRSAPLVLEKIKFRGDEHILDLAGGPGMYMRAFCEIYSNVRMTLLDLPATIKEAKKILAKHNHYNRMSFIGGDLFKTKYPEPVDVIFISNVIHIFDNHDVLTIFKKCYKSLAPGGRLLIKDYYLNDEGTGPEFSSIFSLHMLLSTEGGRCYMPREINSFFREVGFGLGKKTVITENNLVLEGIK